MFLKNFNDTEKYPSHNIQWKSWKQNFIKNDATYIKRKKNLNMSKRTYTSGWLSLRYKILVFLFKLSKVNRRWFYNEETNQYNINAHGRQGAELAGVCMRRWWRSWEVSAGGQKKNGASFSRSNIPTPLYPSVFSTCVWGCVFTCTQTYKHLITNFM